MASVWRHISLWLWLSCLLLAVYSAPVNEDGSEMSATDNQNNDGLTAAIEAVARAKRDTRKKSSKVGHSLVHYRYPIQIKRSAGMRESDEDYAMEGDSSAEDERDDSFGVDELARVDNDVDLDELAKEIALDILMEEADKGRSNEHRSQPPPMKKKKAAPTAHRPRYVSSLDDKRRKRMNSLVNQLLSDDYEGQEDEHAAAAGPVDSEDISTVDDEDEEDEDAATRSMIRALANQGLEPREIDALLSQLERSQQEELKPENKKRSSEWRKLPRASLRWRFLHSMGDNNEPAYGRHQSDDDESSYPLAEKQDKSIPFENRYFGRGFHRVGPHIQDDISRSIPSVTAKRVQQQHPLKTKNALSLINKRSISSPNNQQERTTPIQSSRKRRSPPSSSESKVADQNKLNETTPPPLALPLAEPKTENTSQPDKEVVRKGVHSGVIRKKSVDWDDYFGYDKRSNKADISSEDEAMKEFLESEYYKNLGGSFAFRKRDQKEDHSSHFSEMRKRSNGTSSMEKKRRSNDSNLEDAEDALDAAFRIVQERRQREHLGRVREQLVAELVDNLDEDELDQMTEQLSEELAEAIRQDEEDGLYDDDDETAVKRSAANKLKHKKKKKSQPSSDERRKRFAIKRSQNSRHRSNAVEPVDGKYTTTKTTNNSQWLRKRPTNTNCSN